MKFNDTNKNYTKEELEAMLNELKSMADKLKNEYP